MRFEVLIAACPQRSPRIECRGGIAARQTGVDTVHLVSAAAGPLGGDTIEMRVIVEPGARLRLHSVAATIALPSAATTESHICWLLDVAGELAVNIQPTVVAADARHHSRTRLRLTQRSIVRLRERVQIGRSGERQGFWSSSLHADVEGSPLLRHRIELGAGSLADDELGSPLACVSEFHYPSCDAQTPGLTLALAGGGCLSTWQGDRLHEATFPSY